MRYSNSNHHLESPTPNWCKTYGIRKGLFPACLLRFDYVPGPWSLVTALHSPLSALCTVHSLQPAMYDLSSIGNFKSDASLSHSARILEWIRVCPEFEFWYYAKSRSKGLMHWRFMKNRGHCHLSRHRLLVFSIIRHWIRNLETAGS